MPDARPVRSLACLLAVAALLGVLALARPIDHDESQYVAAAVLAWHGLPYRDFAYLQMPLQPLLFAPIAALSGTLAYPVIRLLNAALGAATVALVYAGARAGGARQNVALACGALFASCDIFLFSVSVARNDALPVAMLAAALWLIMRTAAGKGSAIGAVATGLLLAAAGATKASYAIPAILYGAYALADRRHRPVAVAVGAAPLLLLTGWLYAQAPEAFIFEVIRFPVIGPADWYGMGPRAAKLSLAYRSIDTFKFLALGPALLALAILARAAWRWQGWRARLPMLSLDIMILAGIVAALLPAPTWRQYLLPLLPPLFVGLALVWARHPPRRSIRIATMVFVGAGLAPSIEALGLAARDGLPMAMAMRESAAIRAALDAASVTGPIATLSPQFVPATGRPIDPRFAAGPFLFRGHALLSPTAAARMHVVTRRSISTLAPPPAALLIGGEAAWSSGDAATDAALAHHAPFDTWRRVPLASARFKLLVPARAPAAVNWRP